MIHNIFSGNGKDTLIEKGRVRRENEHFLFITCHHMAAHLKSAGKAHRPSVQDLWLASQAIQHGFPLLTRNIQDFADIPGLQVLGV